MTCDRRGMLRFAAWFLAATAALTGFFAVVPALGRVLFVALMLPAIVAGPLFFLVVLWRTLRGDVGHDAPLPPLVAPADER